MPCAGLLALVLLLVPAAAAAADMVCGPRSAILGALEQTYGERPAGRGVVNAGQLVELLVSPGGATWSLVTTSPRGRSCVIVRGSDWRTREPVETEPKA